MMVQDLPRPLAVGSTKLTRISVIRFDNPKLGSKHGIWLLSFVQWYWLFSGTQVFCLIGTLASIGFHADSTHLAQFFLLDLLLKISVLLLAIVDRNWCPLVPKPPFEVLFSVGLILLTSYFDLPWLIFCSAMVDELCFCLFTLVGQLLFDKVLLLHLVLCVECTLSSCLNATVDNRSSGCLRQTISFVLVCA